MKSRIMLGALAIGVVASFGCNTTSNNANIRGANTNTAYTANSNTNSSVPAAQTYANNTAASMNANMQSNMNGNMNSRSNMRKP